MKYMHMIHCVCTAVTYCYVPPLFTASESRIRNFDLKAKSGFFWDQFGTLVLFGAKTRIWDLFARLLVTLPDQDNATYISDAVFVYRLVSV